MYSSTSSTDKYVLKYKYQVQVLYLTPTLADKLVNITCITSIYVSEVNEVLCSSEKYIYREKNSTKMLLHYNVFFL